MGTSFDERTWNSLVRSLPEPHVLQSWQWGQAKMRNGWVPNPLAWYPAQDSSAGAGYRMQTGPGQGQAAAAALVLSRGIPLRGLSAGLKVFYVPKGPLLVDWGKDALRRQVLADISEYARAEGGIFLKIDPDVRLGSGVPGEESETVDSTGSRVVDDLRAHGWRLSGEQVQFRNTVIVDLRPDEQTLLAAMKQKTRYNIRLAGRKGVQIRRASLEDLGLLYDMYAETSLRDGFVIRDRDYYHALWGDFMACEMAEGLIAQVDDRAVAAILTFRFGGRAWYLFGMSRAEHREKMPNYLLQWEAMRRAKAFGCTSYDLWGAPDVFDPGDPMWGVFRFKDGLGGQVERHIGAWDLPLRRIYYWLYTQLLPKILDLMRARGIARTQRETDQPSYSPGV